jgi:hypothetical protein
MFALNLLEMALVLAEHDRVYDDLASKFFEHFTYIAGAAYEHGLWDDKDGFFHDLLRRTDGTTVPLRVRSVVGLLPLAASTTLTAATLSRLPELGARMDWLLANTPEHAHVVIPGEPDADGAPGQRLIALVGRDLLVRILGRMLDPDEFLSPYGLRSLSAAHRAEPFVLELDGREFRVGYEPGESADGTFGGNSNWRGPVWYPVNYLLIEALRRYGAFFADLRVEYPAGSGHKLTLTEVADDLSRRLVSLFLPDDGRRPMYGGPEALRNRPGWVELIDFPEYFHGDTGLGLGAMHQTGWTALVADLILRDAPDR